VNAVANQVKILFDRGDQFIWLSQAFFDIYASHVLHEIYTRGDDRYPIGFFQIPSGLYSFVP
jgi:hypothetical protein